jgi:excisionase family DNA binding protein
MEYHNEIITIESLMEDARIYRNSEPKTTQATTKKPDQATRNSEVKEGCSPYLTTKEACKFLRCSKSTLWNYAKEGKLKQWQKKRRGMTRWHISELEGIWLQ